MQGWHHVQSMAGLERHEFEQQSVTAMLLLSPPSTCRPQPAPRHRGQEGPRGPNQQDRNGHGLINIAIELRTS